MTVDFPVSETVAVSNVDELRDALASYPAVRVLGSGSAQGRLPAPASSAPAVIAAEPASGEGVGETPVALVQTASMNRILRLETDDLTCSVEPGVRRSDLDQELAARGLWLPCTGQGTLGGLFAADECGPQAPSQAEPRGLLLGMTAVLAEGKVFRSGARVVKNVAGFDLQKLFVGSRGLLFAVTEMHLKLRPMPRAQVDFEIPNLDLEDGLARLRALRVLPTRPINLHLHRHPGAEFRLTGTFHGAPRLLERLGHDHGFRKLATPLDPSKAWADALEAPTLTPTPTGNDASAGIPTGDDPEEALVGVVRFRQLAELLRQLPEQAAFALLGERFVIRAPRSQTDTLLAKLPGLDAAGEIVRASAPRRGLATPGNPTAARSAAALRTALDPAGILR